MNEKKHKTIMTVMQSVFILTLIVLVITMMVQIGNLQGTARVINYAGLVRGATQREVKLEITGNQDDDLIRYLDDILKGLKYANGNYELVKLNDEEYQKHLSSQMAYWEDLKKEILRVRTTEYTSTDIVQMSEEYFKLADKTVSAAENYSEKIAKRIRVIEIFSAIVMVFLIVLILEEYMEAARVAKKNKILEKKAYIDLHTGLPNKSRCEELLYNVEFVQEPLACMMFDLNNLKKANDTFGHSVGDQLILNFARILRNVIPEKDFVGRYGGDEFIVVMYNTTREKTEEVLAQLQEEVTHFNHFGKNFPISYAYGCAYSSDFEECTLRTLLDKADHYMYQNKHAVKAEDSRS